MAKQLEKCNLGIDDRAQLAVIGFAKALQSIPEILGQNLGKNPLNFSGLKSKGNLYRDPLSYGIVDVYSVKVSSIKIASDAAISILRIGDYLPRKGP